MQADERKPGGTVLVWRSRNKHSTAPFGQRPCPMCATGLVVRTKSDEYEPSWGMTSGVPGELIKETSCCPLCGWHSTWEEDTHGYYNTSLYEAQIAELTSFALNSAEVRLCELGSHLKVHAEKLY